MNSRSIASTLCILIATLSIAACSSTGTSTGGKKSNKGGKPPAEAFTACTTKSEGESCSITLPRGEMTGTCKAPPQGTGDLACVPERKEKSGRPS